MRRFKYWLALICLNLAVSSLGAVSSAQERVDVNADERALRAAASEYVAAVRRGDADAIKRMWAADGDYVDASGHVFKVRDFAGRPMGESISETKSAAPSVPTSTLRFITPDVAIEDGIAELGRSTDGDLLSGRFTAVWVKQRGRWLLSNLREAVSSSPSTNDRLQPLAWLLGEWVGTSDDAVILLSSQWSGDGNYIVREFLIRRDGHEDISASQRIGWDASLGEIKSWTFDSQGGSGEGRWRRDDDRWIVESTEVRADGNTAKTVAVYVPGGDGRFTTELKSVSDDKTAGAALPTLRVEFKQALEEE
jgi:uncharacterized protein (TIGR02246 family)